MKATVEKLEKNRVCLHIEVDETQLSQSLEQAYRTVVKKVNVPGFRKGHVPRPVLERFVGKGALFQEALEQLVPDVYEQAVLETGISPIDRPNIDVEEFEENKPLKLKAEVEVKPEVILHEYKGLAAERLVERVTDSSVDHVLYHMRENQAELVTAEHDTVQQGDFVTIDFTGFIDGEPFQGGAAKDYVLEVGSGRFIEGFEQQLIGVAIGANHDVNVTFPADYGSAELAGKDAVFQVSVKEIKERRFPALDDEFAKDVSDFNTLEELRADIRGNLEKQATEKADNDVRDTLVREAAQRAEVEVPAVLVDREVEAMLTDFARSLMYRGIDVDRYMQASGKTPDDLRNDFREDAEKRVRARLVVEVVAEREGITVTPEEVQQRIDEMALSAGNKADEFRARYDEPSRRKALEEDLKVEKAMELLVDKAQITEKEIDAPVEPGHEGHVVPQPEQAAE